MGSFNTLWFLFLSAPRSERKDLSPVRQAFAGGLGLPSSLTGVAISMIGCFGLLLQFGVFSSMTCQVGVLSTFRNAGLLSPIVYEYTLAPLINASANAVPASTPRGWSPAMDRYGQLVLLAGHWAHFCIVTNAGIDQQ